MYRNARYEIREVEGMLILTADLVRCAVKLSAVR